MRLLSYPSPILRRRGEPLAGPQPALRRRVRGMFEIMYANAGLGLAAPQVGWSARVFIVNLTGDESGERVYINPRIVEASAAEEEIEEGCLSIPDVRAKVVRARVVTVEAFDLDGNRFRETGEGIGARAFQHEMDHLDGILFISRISEADKIRIRPQLKELEAEYGKRIAKSRRKVGR